MTLKKQSSDNIIIYNSDSLDVVGLKKDLENLFSIICSESIFPAGDLLLFIDATNGHIAFTSYDHENMETIDGNTLWLVLDEMWEANENASDFDDITSSAIESATETSSGKKLKQKCNLYLQTELDDPIEL